MSDFSIECALIEAESKGLDGSEMLEYAASANSVPLCEAERVYENLFSFQNRIAERLGITL
jgi:hypothetical protein